jgi:hypothetical protein
MVRGLLNPSQADKPGEEFGDEAERGTIERCLDLKNAGCGLTSAILGSILAASGMDGIWHVALRGQTSGHSVIAVRTRRGLLFADGQTRMIMLFPQYMEKRWREAEKWGYRSTTIFDRSFGGGMRSYFALWGRGWRFPQVVDERPPYYLCSRSIG